MKLIRLTDDRYILDAGPEITDEKNEEIQRYFSNWWTTHQDYPTTVVVGGLEEPLIYEDHRDPEAQRLLDIERRLEHLENISWHTHIIHGIDRTGRPLKLTKDDPLTGIEQYQAEDR